MLRAKKTSELAWTGALDIDENLREFELGIFEGREDKGVTEYVIDLPYDVPVIFQFTTWTDICSSLAGRKEINKNSLFNYKREFGGLRAINWELLKYTWNFDKEKRARIEELGDKYLQTDFLIFRTQKDADLFIENIYIELINEMRFSRLENKSHPALPS